MIKKIKKSQEGAAVLVSSIIFSAGLFSVIISLLFISLNMRESVLSFKQSSRNFYAAEAGVGEALYQLRKNHTNYIFADFQVDDIAVETQFIETSGVCQIIPECQFEEGSGWWAQYFNLSVNHPDMEVNPYPGPTASPHQHDWYDDIYKTHEQIDPNLNFPVSMWFPYDGTIWEDKEGFAHDYHFTIRWRAKVTAPANDYYDYSLASDDDSWVLRNGLVVVNNSGTHAAFTKTGTIFLSAGDNIIDIYFAERHTVESGFNFRFFDTSLVITPWPEGCDSDLQCNANIQATAAGSHSSKKARYACNQHIANCLWQELIP
ncbi:MAG: PA14 domain-containing protein [Patescibacteria group bacterium]|nr:PA14 domain-containing protein [Patescibacteria group bacterium]